MDLPKIQYAADDEEEEEDGDGALSEGFSDSEADDYVSGV